MKQSRVAASFARRRNAAAARQHPAFVSTDRTLRVALIGNAPPQACGLATFGGDILEQLGRFQPNVALDLYRLLDAPEEATGGETGLILRHDAAAYAAAAQAINDGNYDAVWLQHEYGIFGGPSGEMACDLVDRLAAPLVLTLHTVLEEPSALQERILRHLIARASRVMVMAHTVRDLLLRRYEAPAELVEVIEHGAPDRPFNRTAQMKAQLGLGDRPVLMTFGLLGPGKGLEGAIAALPAIAAHHPDVLYRIVGATHPVLRARDGEAYREQLIAQAAELGVSDNIEWVNRFVETEDLLDQLEACDIYLTPYLNMQQATSGTLSYAVALGKAVVSTPYIHAAELLADGIGVLVEPRNVEQIAAAVNGLLDDPAKLSAMQRRAWERGRCTVWSEFAARTATMLGAVVPRNEAVPAPGVPRADALLAMSDDTGMYQHSLFAVPDRRHGYCVDDNARALMATNALGNGAGSDLHRPALVYAGFVQDAWHAPTARFRNFMSFSREWLEDEGSEDSNGRAFWALGHTIARTDDEGLRRWAVSLYDQTLPHLAGIGSPRAIAFVMLSAAERLSVEPEHAASREALRRGADVLHRLLHSARRPDWAWFEAMLGYDNPRLAQALIVAGDILEEPEWLAEGLDTLRWITGLQTSAAGYLRPVGSETFGRLHEVLPFDQQPLEAQAHAEACLAAYRAQPDRFWVEQADRAWQWFFGRNDRGVVLVDRASGRCHDGITPRGRNENSGAESVLAFLLTEAAVTELRAVAGADATPSGPTLSLG